MTADSRQDGVHGATAPCPYLYLRQYQGAVEHAKPRYSDVYLRSRSGYCALPAWTSCTSGRPRSAGA